MNISGGSKQLAFVAILALGTGMGAIGVETVRLTWESRNADANGVAASAEIEKAKAAQRAAEAAALEAKNTLESAKAAADAMIKVGYVQAGATHAMARATKDAAELTARATESSAAIYARADNAFNDDFTEPLFLQPAKTLNEINAKLVRAKREAETGIDGKTRRFLTRSELADRIALVAILEEERASLKDTTTQNINDFLGVAVGTMQQNFGQLAVLNPTSNTERSSRLIVQDR